MDSPIVSARFYGHSLDGVFDDLEKKIEKTKKQQPALPSERRRSLFQPSYYKEEFWKQNEALVNAAEHSKDDDILGCFVFQDESGKRRFIVMYPEDFWMECEYAPPERRVLYEVIFSFSICNELS